MNIMITGHRPSGMPYRFGYNINNKAWNELKDIIKEMINKAYLTDKNLNLITGMALGVDQAFWQVADELKKSGKNIKIEAAVPFKGQESKWPSFSQETYNNMIKDCDLVTIVSPGGYSPSKLDLRNHYMVDKSDVVIAICNKRSGGTFNCVKYAQSKHKKIIIINPDNLAYVLQ